MLFEVPGLNLGAPKTEAKNTDTGKNVVIKDKAKTPVKSEKSRFSFSLPLSFEIKKQAYERYACRNFRFSQDYGDRVSKIRFSYQINCLDPA